MSEDRPLAVITGASHRVGRAIAIELARSGFDLILTWHQRRRELEHTIELARDAATRAGASIDVIAHEVDLADEASTRAFMGVLANQPRIDGLVHNASVYAPSPFGEVSSDQMNRDFRVNALSPVLLTQAAAEPLRRSRLPHGASVVFFSDLHVLGRPRLHYLAYTMSKSALSGAIHALARELAPEVRVNGIAPGVIAWPQSTPQHEIDAYEKRIPLGRSGTPDDAARFVRWLIVDSGYVTGEIIRLDGGRWLA